MSKEITELAIKRHDMDANHFQSVYTKQEKYLNKKEKAFLYGRSLVLIELEKKLSQIPEGSKVLDIGCGTAHLTNWIKNKGFEVYGLEPSNEMYHFAKTNFPEIDIRKGISSNLPYNDHFFDLVVAFEVLRYLDKDENIKTYKEIERVLKPNGSFFITQVNLFSTDLYYLFHKIKGIYYKIKKKVHHYCNFTTSKTEQRRASDAGFKNIYTIGVLPGSIRLSYKLGKVIGDSYALICKKLGRKEVLYNSFAKNFMGHLIVIGEKKNK